MCGMLVLYERWAISNEGTVKEDGGTDFLKLQLQQQYIQLQHKIVKLGLFEIARIVCLHSPASFLGLTGKH